MKIKLSALKRLIKEEIEEQFGIRTTAPWSITTYPLVDYIIKFLARTRGDTMPGRYIRTDRISFYVEARGIGRSVIGPVINPSSEIIEAINRANTVLPMGSGPAQPTMTGAAWVAGGRIRVSFELRNAIPEEPTEAEPYIRDISNRIQNILRRAQNILVATRRPELINITLSVDTNRPPEMHDGTRRVPI